jgi:hypothetical protein
MPNRKKLAPELLDRDISKAEFVLELSERAKPVERLHNNVTANPAPFIGCGRKRKPIHILSAPDKLTPPRNWTEKCGSERGVDSGQHFICPDCAARYGYRW